MYSKDASLTSESSEYLIKIINMSIYYSKSSLSEISNTSNAHNDENFQQNNKINATINEGLSFIKDDASLEAMSKNSINSNSS